MLEEQINGNNIVVFHPGIINGNCINIVFIGNYLVVNQVGFNTPQTIISISINYTYKSCVFSCRKLNGIRTAKEVVVYYYYQRYKDEKGL
jgi:hypothetical protein